MSESELDEIEARLIARDESRIRDDLRRLIEEVRTLRGYVSHAEESMVHELVKNPPLP